jgi:hypothetical protein
MDDLEKRDTSLVLKWFADNGVLWMPPSEPIEGARRVAAMFRVIFRMYAEIHWKVTDVYPVSDVRFIYMTDSWGTIGKSTPYRNSIMSIIEFNAENKITYLSDYFKDTAIFNAAKTATST